MFLVNVPSSPTPTFNAYSNVDLNTFNYLSELIEFYISKEKIYVLTYLYILRTYVVTLCL